MTEFCTRGATMKNGYYWAKFARSGAWDIVFVGAIYVARFGGGPEITREEAMKLVERWVGPLREPMEAEASDAHN